MYVNFELNATRVVTVLASLSRVQHHNGNTDTEFRLVIDGIEVARTNSGYTYQWDFKPIAFHGVSSLLEAGTHTAAVEYKTAIGTAMLFSDAHAPQQRQITILEQSPTDVLTQVRLNDTVPFEFTQSCSPASNPDLPCMLTLPRTLPHVHAKL
jgi:hypothetical protein